MRRTLWSLLIVALALGSVGAAWIAYAHHDNAYRVERAQNVVRDLQQLAIGKSDYRIAEAMATKFGNAPPPEGREYYRENCAARDHLERCTYFISLNNSPVAMALVRHPFLPHLGFRDWSGYAQISVASGTVTYYSFWVWYKASNGRWRGFGAREGPTLPKFAPVVAHISDSYSIRLEELKSENGFGLESSLTPVATAAERQAAWHFDFACLGQKKGCGEICEVMPDAWKDFYEKRGHLDAERLGSAYLFCNKPPK
jgi:hypothetical protein